MTTLSSHTNFIKTQASKLGFSFCGIAQAAPLSDEVSQLEQWLKKGYHGKMDYMERNFEKRLDPTLLVPGAKSVVSLLYNYFPQQKMDQEGTPKISKYAYGEDYHIVVKERLAQLMDSIGEQVGEVQGRAFVDSAPVMERAWAQKSGLGWIGKNSLLLNRKMGSFFFLAELIIDLALDYDHPIKDYCGSCTACMDACPTNAITEPYVVDASQCISYFTIELKDEIPVHAKGKFDNWMFGCDICQDVCPWNRFSVASKEERFKPNEVLSTMQKKEWEEITESVFKTIFKKSAVKRAGFKGLKRNIKFLQQKA